ncbi:MAG TPA: GLPGLI family protein [Alloprevotella sp.]|nr:GLPGLI family protein [Alloprevotella sp.]
MKQTTTFLFLCFVAIAAIAQQKADIEVGYMAHHPNLRNGKDDLTSQYILLANADGSKFFSPKTEYVDSLNSTPNGKAKLNEMKRNAYLGGKLDDIPRSDGSYYVVKSSTANKYIYYDNSGLEKYMYEEQIAKLGWEITDSTKNVLGYECIMATVDYHGRRWTAWFSPGIPMNAGPWKLAGLPGLILEATADGNQYSFAATGIQQVDKPITPIYLANEYEKTDRLKFLRARRSFLDNPLGKINAQFAGSGVSVSKVRNEDGSDATGSIFAPVSVVDLIETDYH